MSPFTPKSVDLGFSKMTLPGDSFVAHVLECMEAFGSVDARRMFGGWGLYREDVFFGLVMDEVLYLRTDELNSAAFDARQLPHFTFVKGGKTIETQYRAVPEEALEDPRVMAEWAREAFAAALRETAAKGKRKARQRRG